MTGRLYPLSNRNGFTLIELAIVLVIVGLLAGGVLAGQTLIGQAQLRKGASDMEKLQTSITTFKLKYDCLPGDCSTAAAFLTNCSNVSEYPWGQYNSCNGNGNGAYDSPIEGIFRIYQHLNLAGMLTWNIPNIAYGSGLQEGVNVPTLDWADANNVLYGSGIYGSSGISLFVIESGWGYATTNGCEPTQPAMIGTQDGLRKIVISPIRSNLQGFVCRNGWGGISRKFAVALDQKFDDGFAFGGRIRAPAWYPYLADQCVNAAGYLTSALGAPDSCVIGFVIN